MLILLKNTYSTQSTLIPNVYIVTLPESSIKKEKTPKVGRKKPESGTPDIAVKITPTEVTDDVLKTMFSQHQGHDEYITIREEVSTIQPNLQVCAYNLYKSKEILINVVSNFSYMCRMMYLT